MARQPSQNACPFARRRNSTRTKPSITHLQIGELLVLRDPVENPSVSVLTTDALSLLEQAPRPPRHRGLVLCQQRSPGQDQRAGWRRRLNSVACKRSPSLVVEFNSPVHPTSAPRTVRPAL